MNRVIILALVFLHFQVCLAATPYSREFIEKILIRLNLGKPGSFNFIQREADFINALNRNDEFRTIAVKEASEFGFLKRKPWTKETFPCKNYSIPGSGTDVNNLTPLDIRVVAALGDSLTAGVGIDATTIFGILWENRGKVFSIGGRDGASTLPNFFKVFNPTIKGFSTKTTFIRNKGDAFNVGVSGDTSENLMAQLNNLLNRMKNDKTVDMKNDWKMLTIFIGNNDICRSCESKHAAQFTVELYKERLIAVLDKLMVEVPKLFVSLVPLLDVYRVSELNKGLICSAAHLYSCPCVAFPKNITNIIDTTTEFQTVVSDITNSDRYDGKPDFAVVTQPFFENTFVPKIGNEPDLSYFAPDCFHLSEKGQAQAALALWNSLFQPIATKKRYWHVGETFECPTNDYPFLTTKLNSISKT